MLQMFGFKHTMNGIDHNSPANRLVRTRLYSRLLQVNGPIYLENLFPFLKQKLDKTLQAELNKGKKVEGMMVFIFALVDIDPPKQVASLFL